MALEVVRAQYAGACYGVQRALDMTNEAAKGNQPVYTLGPLIHNPGVVQDLERRGIKAVSSEEEPEAGVVVIRSHGVVPSVLDHLEQRNLSVVDATCPHVMRAQRAAAKLARDGYYVLVVGEAGHPEVEGIAAHAQAAGGVCCIVGNVEDIPERIPEKVGVVVQTTQSRAKLDEIIEALTMRGLKPCIKDTICFATTQRQQAAVELAQTVDAMVVIGGRNSSNTTRLFELCQSYCPAAYHIERAEEIDPSWFVGIARVGITAGASTPEDQIKPVEEYLARIS